MVGHVQRHDGGRPGLSNAESSPDYIVGLAIAPGNWSSSAQQASSSGDLTGNDDEPFQHAGRDLPSRMRLA